MTSTWFKIIFLSMHKNDFTFTAISWSQFTYAEYKLIIWYPTPDYRVNFSTCKIIFLSMHKNDFTFTAISRSQFTYAEYKLIIWYPTLDYQVNFSTRLIAHKYVQRADKTVWKSQPSFCTSTHTCRLFVLGSMIYVQILLLDKLEVKHPGSF